VKKVPIRTCIGCNEGKPKRELIRIVKTAEAEVLVEEAKSVLLDTLATIDLKEDHEWNELRNQIRKPLRNFFYKKTKRTPMILPIIFRV